MTSWARGTTSVWIALLLLACAVFAGNVYHRTEQGIYARHHLPLAESLAGGAGYQRSPDEAEPPFYPIWGYPIALVPGVTLGAPGLGVLLLQLALACGALAIGYRLAPLRPALWHVPLLVPYFAVASVRWPDAFVAPLMLLYVVAFARSIAGAQLRWAVVAGLCLGLCVNLRTEYLLLPLVQGIGLALPPLRSRTPRRGLAACAVAGGTALLLLAPWALRSYAYDGSLRLGSTNGGGVLYISLGQLPQNPWQIEHADRAAAALARRRGADTPWSIEGDRVLRRAFAESVREHPWAYARKVATNLARALTGGVYSGELHRAVVPPERLAEVEARIDEAGVPAGLRMLSPARSAGFLSVKLVDRAFRVVFCGLLVMGVWVAFASRGGPHAALVGTALALAAARLAVVSLVQYQSRHMNAAFVPLLFAVVVGGGVAERGWLRELRARLRAVVGGRPDPNHST